MRKRVCAALALLLLLCLGGAMPSSAEEPEELTDRCVFRLESGGKFADRKIRDNDYRTYMSLGAGRAVLIEVPGQHPGSLTLRYYDRVVKTEIWAECGGEWVLAAET